MKKVLLAGTALLGLVLTSAPASAELNLDLGGHFRGYGVWNDNDDSVTTASSRDFDFRRDSEIHFTGEATSDNGLTVGAHYEAFVGGALATDEAYAYFAGNWGRTNFGSEDGAAYLLQVAAPSADSNVDGLRNAIQATNGLEAAATGSITANGYTGVYSDNFGTTQAAGNLLLDYDHADFQDTERLTYLTPKFSGFQAGVSYAPEAGQKGIGNGLATVDGDSDANEFENLWEAAVRWDGEFEGFGISAGAGYSTAGIEADGGGAAVVGAAADDVDTWNAGLNVAFRGFSVGGAYLDSQTAVGDAGLAGSGDEDVDATTWVVGAAWDNGPYHVGVSYLDQEIEVGAGTLETDRWTAGVGYTYGPGMSFRGAVSMGEVENDGGGANLGAAESVDNTAVTIGTDIQF